MSGLPLLCVQIAVTETPAADLQGELNGKEQQLASQHGPVPGSALTELWNAQEVVGMPTGADCATCHHGPPPPKPMAMPTLLTRQKEGGRDPFSAAHGPVPGEHRAGTSVQW